MNLSPSQHPLSSNLHVINGDECGPPWSDLQPHLSEEWAHLQPASPAVDLHLWLCCKYDHMKFVCALVHDLKHPLCARAAGRTDTDWRLSICPLRSVQVRDYSGTYTVKLIPCTTAQNMEYAVPPVCNPREPITFDLDIRFQQVRQSLFEPWLPKVACLFVIGRFDFLSSSPWLSLSSCGTHPSLGERPSCRGIQSKHSDVPAVQEEFMALWWFHGFRSWEWHSLLWG